MLPGTGLLLGIVAWLFLGPIWLAGYLYEWASTAFGSGRIFAARHTTSIAKQIKLQAKGRA